MATKDVHNNKGEWERYKEKIDSDWKAVASKGMPLNKINSEWIIQYVTDMEQGKNIGKMSKKGARGYATLNKLKSRMPFIAYQLEKRGVTNISNTSEKIIFEVFNDMRKGRILKSNKQPYTAVGSYVKVWKSFWHWYMKLKRKDGVQIIDICEDLDAKDDDPAFVYLTKEDLYKLISFKYFDKNLNKEIYAFTPEEQLLLLFIFDSCIRAPEECFSLCGKHIEIKKVKNEEIVMVYVTDEIASKTGIGREFNLLFCADEMKKHIEKHNIGADDEIFGMISYPYMNRKIKKIAFKIWGNKLSNPIAKGLYKDLVLYDARHSGCIHLRILAQENSKITLDKIRQRAGWRDFKMLNYYTRFIKLNGIIDKNDVLIEEDKSQLQKDLAEQDLKIKAMQQQMKAMQESMKNMAKYAPPSNESPNKELDLDSYDEYVSKESDGKLYVIKPNNNQY